MLHATGRKHMEGFVSGLSAASVQTNPPLQHAIVPQRASENHKGHKQNNSCDDNERNIPK